MGADVCRGALAACLGMSVEHGGASRAEELARFDLVRHGLRGGRAFRPSLSFRVSGV